MMLTWLLKNYQSKLPVRRVDRWVHSFERAACLCTCVHACFTPACLCMSATWTLPTGQVVSQAQVIIYTNCIHTVYCTSQPHQQVPKTCCISTRDNTQWYTWQAYIPDTNVVFIRVSLTDRIHLPCFEVAAPQCSSCFGGYIYHFATDSRLETSCQWAISFKGAASRNSLRHH